MTPIRLALELTTDEHGWWWAHVEGGEQPDVMIGPYEDYSAALASAVMGLTTRYMRSPGVKV